MDNKELEGLLLYAGVGILVLFLLFSMLSLWSNGMVFTWITAKYFLLMGCGALTLVLEDSARRRYGIAFAAFLGLLAFGDNLTFSGRQIRDIASADSVAAERAVKDFTDGLAHMDGDGLELAQKQAMLRAIENAPLKGDEDDDRDKAVDELKDDIKEINDEFKDEEVEFDDVEELAELQWTAKQEEKDVEKQRENLTWAKSLDSLILLGGFFILAGALVGGAPEEDDYYGTSTYSYGGTASSAGSSAPTSAPAAPAAPAAKPAAAAPAAKPAPAPAAPAAAAAKPAAPEAPAAAKPAAPEAPPAPDKPTDGGATA